MTTTVAVERDGVEVTGHRALALVRLRRASQLDADLALVRSLMEWAVEHEVEPGSGHGAVFEGSDLALAGPGAPHVAEFAFYELAAALGRSLASAKLYVGDVLEVRYRLPRLWARVDEDGLPMWRATRIAQQTRTLPLDGALYVDRMLAPTAHALSHAQLDRTVADALVRYAPEEADARAAEAAERRGVEIDLDRVGAVGLGVAEGTVEVQATLDAVDALDLEHAVRGVADQLRDLGSQESRDVRRAQALGEIARAQLSLDLTGRPGNDTGDANDIGAPAPRPGRGVALFAHLHPDTTLVDLDTAGMSGPGWIGQVKEWCRTAGTTVTVVPVVDLAADLATAGYAPTGRIRGQVELRDGHCVAPYCTRPARACDLDHVVPHAMGGPTSSHNLAPLCRRHHRAKTHHPGWTYEVVRPGVFRWTLPSGITFRVDLTGTHPD